MYKKITHYITEEHFDHPVAANIKKHVETKQPIRPKGFYVINDNLCHGLDQFEKNNIYAWSGLAWVVGELVNSIVDGTSDQAELLGQFVAVVDKISKMTSPIATNDQVGQFKNLLTAYGQAALAVVTDVAAGKDTTANMAVLTTNIAELSTFLNSLESSWDAAVLTTILTGVATDYVAKTTARMQKDWAAEGAAGGRAYRTLVVSQDNGSPSLADIFFSGIVN
jgi:hypothetical protein